MAVREIFLTDHPTQKARLTGQMGTKFGNQSSYGKKQEEKLAKEVIEKQGKYSKKDEDKLQAEIEESSNDNK